MFDKIVKWLIVSSADADKTSATVQGVLLQYVGLILVVAQLLHIPYTENEIVSLITSVSVITGTALMAFGLLRKLYFEVKALFSK